MRRYTRQTPKTTYQIPNTKHIDAYLQVAGRGTDRQGAMFRRVENNVHDNDQASISPDGIYKMVMDHAKTGKIDIVGFEQHTLWATAATNALDHNDDIAKDRGDLPMRISRLLEFTDGAKCS